MPFEITSTHIVYLPFNTTIVIHYDVAYMELFDLIWITSGTDALSLSLSLSRPGFCDEAASESSDSGDLRTEMVQNFASGVPWLLVQQDCVICSVGSGYNG